MSQITPFKDTSDVWVLSVLEYPVILSGMEVIFIP